MLVAFQVLLLPLLLFPQPPMIRPDGVLKIRDLSVYIFLDIRELTIGVFSETLQV
jgi:hypothetical protein